jgi:glutamate racemase
MDISQHQTEHQSEHQSRHQTVVMDWGTGGLTVYREIKRLDPKRGIVYFSDSGVQPYGKMRQRDLEARVAKVCEFVVQQGIREIVIACNAASTVAPQMRKRFHSTGLHIVDVISAGIRTVQSTSFRRVGVIGGRRTILSRIYQRALSTPRRHVEGRIAQPLSALIERGELDSSMMHTTLRRILRPLRHADAILLACTHYPAIRNLIQAFVPGTDLLDPSVTTARELLAHGCSQRVNGSPDIFLTTGDPRQSARVARVTFGTKVECFIKVRADLRMHGV